MSVTSAPLVVLYCESVYNSTFWWNPAHVYVKGNVQTDKVAKTVSLYRFHMPPPLYGLVPLSLPTWSADRLAD